MIVSFRQLRLFKCKGRLKGPILSAYFAENYIPRREAMTTPITSLIRKSTTSILRLALLSSLVAATPLFAADGDATNHSAHEQSVPSKLVELVRAGTKHYIDVNAATAAGYGPFLGCVAGTDHGAMGVHYVNGTLLGNLTLDPAQPQAPIYEPVKGKVSILSPPRIASTFLPSSSSTSGPGGATHKARSWTGTTT